MIASKAKPHPLFASISDESVKAALDALLFNSRPRVCNPLEDLLLVDKTLMDSSFPPSASHRSYVLSHILTSMITDVLIKHRRALGIMKFEPELDYENTLEAIASDARTTNPELLGWSWLYHHYVRVDLNISPDVFCHILSINQRTLQRYRQAAVQQLVFRLIDQERGVRKKYQQHRLYAQLPTAAPLTLYGREEALKKLDELSVGSVSRHFQVFGASGVGKTALVQKAVRSLIDREALESVVWLEMPLSVHEIRQRLARFLDEQETCISIREFVQHHPTAFVLDGMDPLCHDLDSLQRILDDLTPAVVYLTACRPLPTRSSMNYIGLSELEQPDAHHLIEALSNKWCFQGYEPLAQAEIQWIWENAAGNPGAIERAVLEFQMQRVYESMKIVSR